MKIKAILLLGLLTAVTTGFAQQSVTVTAEDRGLRKDYAVRYDEMLRASSQDPMAPGLKENYLWLIREGSSAGYWKEVGVCYSRLKQLTANDPEFMKVHAYDCYGAWLSAEGIKDFEESGLNNESLNLKASRGKVLLLDFWATWCPPCRAEMPNVKRIYGLYHERGLEIIGISADRSLNALSDWLETEGLSWPQFCPGGRTQNPLFKLYGIVAIPTTVLIDREGKLAAVNLRGEELEARIAELVGKGPAEILEKPVK